MKHIDDLEKLTWKTVNHPEIKNMEISEFGHLRRETGSFMNIIRIGTIDNNGYRSVKLMIEKKKFKKFLVHRLVMMTFNPENYFEGAIVDHRNEQKLDNHCSNLQWLSRTDNLNKNRKFNNITGGVRRKLTDKEVRKCRKLYQMGISVGTIWRDVLQKKITYPSVLNMLKNLSYRNVK